MSEKAPGNERYTPTRLDWLAVMLNSLLPMRAQGKNLEVMFASKNDGKTLVIFVRYDPDTVDEERLGRIVEKLKLIVNEMAKNYEWASWLKVELQFQKTGSNRQQKEDLLDK